MTPRLASETPGRAPLARRPSSTTCRVACTSVHSAASAEVRHKGAAPSAAVLIARSSGWATTFRRRTAPAFEKALSPCIKAGRKTTSASRRSVKMTSPGGDPGDREWLRSSGFPNVKDRGPPARRRYRGAQESLQRCAEPGLIPGSPLSTTYPGGGRHTLADHCPCESRCSKVALADLPVHLTSRRHVEIRSNPVTLTVGTDP